MLKLAISGACGKMGSRILSLAETDKSVEIGGLIEGIDFTSREILFRSGKIKTQNSAESVLSNSDVLIEFTAPAATIEHLETAVNLKKPVVIGTTGFNEDELKKINFASSKIPIVMSPNMSIGVNLLFKIVKDVSAVLKDYDTEIVELHHNQKKDSPSGTAAKLAQIIAEQLGKKIIYGREGIVGPRTKQELAVHAVRAGDIVGEHTVYFAGPGERVEFTHRAHSRDCFASGAIIAAKWIVNKEPWLYSMQEVLEI